MRSLTFLLAVSLTAQASSGFPVYRTLKENVYQLPGYGTGFTVEYNDKIYMITNWHVCRYFKYYVAKNERSKVTTTVRVLRSFPNQDLCVMSTSEDHGLKLGSDAGEGSAVYYAGYPRYAKTLQLRSGYTIVEHSETLDFGPGYCPKGFEKGATMEPTTHQTIETCEHSQQVMDTSLEGTYGSSGSPVVNSRGQLVGVVHSTTDNPPHDDHHGSLNYIPVRVLVKILRSLKP